MPARRHRPMKPPLDTRSNDPARVLVPNREHESRIHLDATLDIAEMLYGFPTPAYPHFRTFLNVPEVQQRVFTNFGRELTPDIVVVEWPERTLKIVGEVATPARLTMDEALDRWLPESRLEDVAFYLYVPAGYVQHSRRLLKEAGIKRKDLGLRSWRRFALAGRPEIATY